jgi:hypothetical protein
MTFRKKYTIFIYIYAKLFNVMQYLYSVQFLGATFRSYS